VSITDRDRKILMALIPVIAIVAYWFLLLAPKREEASKVRDDLTQAQNLRDTAQQKASQLAGAKRSFSADYATVIRLGKSIPTSVDMPSLLVQLDRAARGTGIDFTNVTAGQRSPAGGAAATGGTPGGGSSGPTAPGAAPAQSGPGQAAQSASGAVQSANGASAAAGGSGTTGPAADAGGAPGLENVPLDFEFDGSFFDLADFFHRMKRFVRVANNRIVIRGRLMTINSFSFDAGTTFPQIKATVNATVYLAPKAQGVAAGATPQGPGSGPAGAGPQTASTPSSTPTPTPTATVTAP
jgi:Pilus assembly protein, PilO